MKIKSRTELLKDIIKDAKKHPTGWRAIFGRDQQRLSTDYYIFHPHVGLYLLKEYTKNPFSPKGIGGKIVRHVDEDIVNEISRYSGDFGIIQSDIKKIASNLQMGVQPDQILSAAFQGKDLGLTIPVRGQASSENDSFRYLHENLSTKQRKIDLKFEKLAAEDGLYDAYR